MQIEVGNPIAEVHGEGSFSLPGQSIPPPDAAAMVLDPVLCIQAYSHDPQVVAWICRAVHAEIFARALEKELEALRAANRCQN